MEVIIKHCDQLEGFARSLREMGNTYKGECEREVKREFEQRLAVAGEVKEEYTKQLATKDQVIAAQKQTIKNQDQTIAWLRSQIDAYTQPAFSLAQQYEGRVQVASRSSPAAAAGGYQPRKRRRLNTGPATPTLNSLDVHEVKMENETPVQHAPVQQASGLSPAAMARAMPRLPQFASHMETLAPISHSPGQPWSHPAPAPPKPKKPKSTRNSRPPGNKTSRFRGVGWYVVSRQWRARISDNEGRCIHIGYYGDDEVAAAKAWDKKARELRGEDTWTNFLPDGTRRPPKRKRSGYKTAAPRQREAKQEVKPVPVAARPAPPTMRPQPRPRSTTPPRPAPPLETDPPRAKPPSEGQQTHAADGDPTGTEPPARAAAPANPAAPPEVAAPAAKPKATQEAFYQVERILDHRMANGVEQFFVKWRGYDEDKSTWEPIENFEKGRDDAYIQTYLAKQGQG